MKEYDGDDQIALAVGHKTDNKTPHEYDYEKQVTMLE